MAGQYQILNRTGKSSVIFTEKYDAMYLFNVKIIDPDYRYALFYK